MNPWLRINFDLFVSFLRVGVSGFGGGQSLVPLIEDEVVRRNAWVTTEEFADLLAIGNTFPGPISTKLASYVGYQQTGIAGAACSLSGLVLPTAIAMVLVAGALLHYRDHARVHGLLRGVRPAVIGMLAVMVFRYGSEFMVDRTSFAIAGVVVAVLAATPVPPALVMIAAAAMGALFLGPA